MSEQWTLTGMDEKLRAATRMPMPRPEFVASLRAKLGAEPPRPLPLWTRLGMTLRRRGWSIALALLLVLAAAFFAIGPQRVAAAVRGLLGYIPGVGIVDQEAPIRILAEPVSLAREGISITVTSATLTGDKTHIEYRVFGVPASAYPDREDVTGCIQREYLRLPDGVQLTRVDNDFPPIPAEINDAVFVIPCLHNTLPGKAPENWKLPLRFKPAPPDLVVMPVIELSPSPQPSPIPGATELPENESGAPAAPVDRSVTISKVIETSDGYILIGRLAPQSQPGEWLQVTGAPVIRDASGKKVPYTFPQDINPDVVDSGQSGTAWALQFKADGLTYPLTITFTGVEIRQVDPNAVVEFTFDAGPNPQPGQEWTPDQEFQIAGHTLKLISITTDARNGYSFRFQGDPEVYSASVQIVGHTPTGGGGGGGGGLTGGVFNVSLSYPQLPTGVLTVTLSNLAVIGDKITWQGQWQPDALRSDWPTPANSSYTICLDAAAIEQLAPLPAGLDGRALLTELNPEIALVLSSFDGSQRKVLASKGSRGALSPDRQQMAFADSEGIKILDLSSGAAAMLTGTAGRDLHWSPDGNQIAFVTAGSDYGIFVASIDGSGLQQLSNLGYETIAGWSPDGQRLYYAIPSSSSADFLLRSVEVLLEQPKICLCCQILLPRLPCRPFHRMGIGSLIVAGTIAAFTSCAWMAPRAAR